MDYDNVNNPFITLRKLSGDDSDAFTAKLNTSPPLLQTINICQIKRFQKIPYILIIVLIK